MVLRRKSFTIVGLQLPTRVAHIDRGHKEVADDCRRTLLCSRPCPTGAGKAMARELDSGQRQLIEPRYLALELGRHGFGGTLARHASR